MNLDAIRSFLHVSETGSFSVAAQRLGVMQSTISGRIQALEEELGCLLFSRGRGGAELTPAGYGRSAGPQEKSDRAKALRF